jgi:hypothetical protein
VGCSGTVKSLVMRTSFAVPNKLVENTKFQDERIMVSLWQAKGRNLDLGYINLCEAKYREEQEIRAALDAMWAIFEPYADPDFCDGFARDPEARFWEMYVGCRLLWADKALLPASERRRNGGQPDLCVIDGDRRVWIEAIAPDLGAEGPDQVRGPRLINDGGGFEPAPIRQAQLRATGALRTKSRVIENYIREGIIGSNDVRLIAIGAGRFGAHVSEWPLPLIMSALFPIGDMFVTLDRFTGGVIDQGFEASLHIVRHGEPIERTAFINDLFSHISGVLWSRIGIGNMDSLMRPLTFVHNPNAAVRMPESWGVWDREFVTMEYDDYWQARDILDQRAD